MPLIPGAGRGPKKGAPNAGRPTKARAQLIEAQRVVAVTAAALTVERHLSRLEDLAARAEAAGQFGPAITAETKRGEVAGFYIRRNEDVTKMSPAEREQRVADLLAKRGLKLVKEAG